MNRKSEQQEMADMEKAMADEDYRTKQVFNKLHVQGQLLLYSLYNDKIDISEFFDRIDFYLPMYKYVWNRPEREDLPSDNDATEEYNDYYETIDEPIVPISDSESSLSSFSDLSSIHSASSEDLPETVLHHLTKADYSEASLTLSQTDHLSTENIAIAIPTADLVLSTVASTPIEFSPTELPLSQKKKKKVGFFKRLRNGFKRLFCCGIRC